MLFEIRRAQNGVLDRIQVTPFPHIWPDALFARTSRVFLIKQYTKLANRARSLPTSRSRLSQLEQGPDQAAEQLRDTDQNTGPENEEPVPVRAPLTRALGIDDASACCVAGSEKNHTESS